MYRHCFKKLWYLWIQAHRPTIKINLMCKLLSFVNIKYKGVDFHIAYSCLYIYLQFAYYQNSLVFTYIEFKKIVS